MAANAPFTRGQHATLKLFQDGKPVLVKTKNFNWKENATEINDPVNGETRDRLDKVINFYEIDCNIYMSDLNVLRSVQEAQELDDAAGIPLKQTCGVKLQHRDGTNSYLLFTECKFGPFGAEVQDRSGAVMLSYKIRARFMREVQAI